MTTVARQKKDTTGFGGYLRDLRKAAGITQAELASRSGMIPQAIARLESGDRVPSWETVIRVAVALGVSTEAFRPKT